MRKGAFFVSPWSISQFNYSFSLIHIILGAVFAAFELIHIVQMQTQCPKRNF